MGHSPISITIDIDPLGIICPPCPPEHKEVLDAEKMCPPPLGGLPCIPRHRKEPGETILRKPQGPCADKPPCPAEPPCPMKMPPEIIEFIRGMCIGQGDKPIPDDPVDTGKPGNRFLAKQKDGDDKPGDKPPIKQKDDDEKKKEDDDEE